MLLAPQHFTEEGYFSAKPAADATDSPTPQLYPQMDPCSRPSFIALAVILALVSTGLTQVQDMLYFSVWTGNGESLMSHIKPIKEQANFFQNRLVDIGTKEHLQKTGALEDSKVVVELDTDVFAKARAKMARVENPTLAQHYEEFYNRLHGEYESLRGIGFYAAASDILRYVAFTAYSDQADQLVYHDADVRFEPLQRQRQTTSLGSGADMRLVMIGLTKRKDPSMANQLAFIEPSYFYERKLPEYPECVQFNTDLIFMRKSAAMHSAVAIGIEQLRTIAASQRSLVEKVVGNEKTKMTLHDAIQTTHPEEARFAISRETSRLLYKNELHRQPEYTHAELKASYTAAVGLNPVDGLLQKAMDAKYKAAGPQSTHVEIEGEVFLRREEMVLLRTLLVKGDRATVKSFISESALSPADVGAVSRQDGRHWFGVAFLTLLSAVWVVPPRKRGAICSYQRDSVESLMFLDAPVQKSPFSYHLLHPRGVRAAFIRVVQAESSVEEGVVVHDVVLSAEHFTHHLDKERVHPGTEE